MHHRIRMSGGQCANSGRYARWANAADFAAVRALWWEGFPTDTDQDVADFWRMASDAGRCLLLMEGNTPVSMAFLLPAHMGAREWWYVYAAATRRDRRGQGCFRQLLDEAVARAAENGAEALFLRPAEPSLFTYYARCGFSPLCHATEIEWQVDSLYSNLSLNALQSVENGYADIRRTWLKQLGVPHIDWSSAVADYAVEMAKKAGGGALFSDCGVALCERWGDCLTVRELLCAPDGRLRMANSLARHFTCQKVILNTPPMGEIGTAFGMVRPCGGRFLQKASLYMGFALE